MFYTSALNTPKSPDLDLNCIERQERRRSGRREYEEERGKERKERGETDRKI